MTSAARWERDGWYRRSLRNLLLPDAVCGRRAAAADCADLLVKDTVFVFARAPRLGAVKRRLAREIGDRAALRFHQAMLAVLRAGARPAFRDRAGHHARPRAARWPVRVPALARVAAISAHAWPGRSRGGDERLWWAATFPAALPPTSARPSGAGARRCGVRPGRGRRLLAGGSVRAAPARPFAAVRWSTAHALADTLANFRGLADGAGADAERCRHGGRFCGLEGSRRFQSRALCGR